MFRSLQMLVTLLLINLSSLSSHAYGLSESANEIRYPSTMRTIPRPCRSRFLDQAKFNAVVRKELDPYIAAYEKIFLCSTRACPLLTNKNFTKAGRKAAQVERDALMCRNLLHPDWEPFARSLFDSFDLTGD